MFAVMQLVKVKQGFAFHTCGQIKEHVFKAGLVVTSMAGMSSLCCIMRHDKMFHVAGIAQSVSHWP
jgi:hypothetical protein